MLPQESVITEINVPVTMRDGTILYTNIFRPGKEGKYPAVLMRMPYVKDSGFVTGRYFDPVRMVRSGYVVVAEDCRGTGASEGEYHQFVNDVEDGYDTVEWVAAQPWCNGNVGMYGHSYLGCMQMLAALSRPPHLKAICPAQVSHSLRGMPMWENGVFLLRLGLMWFNGQITSELAKGDLPPEKLKSLRQRFQNIMENPDEMCRVLPLLDVPSNLIARELRLGSTYSDWITNVEDDSFWKKLYNPLPLEKIDVPAFHLGGWYHHAITSAVLKNFMVMKEKGPSELIRKSQKLLIGPWVHVGTTGLIGDLDFGIAAAGSSIDFLGKQIRWFDYWLKGINNGIIEEPPVNIFVMGSNVWRDENEWPLARAKYVKYYFHSGGHANSRHGDGVLSTEYCAEEEPDIYLYDPRNPVPTKIGTSGDFYVNIFGAYDQQDIEDRSDVLVYTTPVLRTDIEVTGPIIIKLYASSSAVDTDFTGKLVDVWPDGRAYNVVDGVVRARYRESVSNPQMIKPNKVYEYSIDLRNTSNVFKAGHRIRVEVSSSSFPKWDRNLNTGHPIGRDAEIKVAVQTIYHNNQYHSHILLPVIPV